MQVEVMYCPGPGQIDQAVLQLTPGATVLHALQASGVLDRHGLHATTVRVGVWGRAQALDGVLRDRDRVEVYRPLRVDPKEARRQRYGRHKQAAQERAQRKAASGQTAEP